MEDSRAVLRSLSKSKQTFIHQDGHGESKALDMKEKGHQKQLPAPPPPPPQEYRRVGRKIYNSRKAVKQDPRNASGMKATKGQDAEERIPYPYAIKDGKADKKDKTEEELKHQRLEMEKDIKKHEESYYYSEYYYNEEHEFRHVVLPKQILKWIPHNGLLSDEEWRALGIKQSKGWEHYMVYAPEPHVLLFKRELNYIQKYGNEDKKAVKSTDTTQQGA